MKIDFHNLPVSNRPLFSVKAKSVKLDKSWFVTDLLWSSGDGHRIGVERIICIYMRNPDQRNTDVLIKLFGTERVEAVVKKHFDFNEATKGVKSIALEQVNYGITAVCVPLNTPKIQLDTDNLSKAIRKATQERIDKIIKKVGERTLREAAEKLDFPFSFEIQDKIDYAVKKSKYRV